MTKEKNTNIGTTKEFKDVLTSSPLCEFWKYNDGEVFFVSNQCANVFKYNSEEITDNPELLAKIVVEEDKAKWEKFFRAKSTSGKNGEVIVKVKTKKGKLAHLLFFAKPIKSKIFNGKRIVAVDVTEFEEKAELLNEEKERIKKELTASKEKIRETLLKLEKTKIRLEHESTLRRRALKLADMNSEKLKTILDSDAFGVVLFEMSENGFGKIVQTNRRFEKLTGYKRKELLNKHVEFIFPKKELADSYLIKSFLKLEKNKTFSKKVEILRKDGSLFYAGITATKFELLGNDTVFAFINDLSEQKKLVEQIIVSEAHYKNFIVNFRDPIFRIEFDPPIPIDLSAEKQARLMIRRGRIAECNTSFANFYGFKNKDDVVGRTFSFFFGSEKNKKNIERNLRFIKEGYTNENDIEVEKNSKGENVFFINSIWGDVNNNALERIWGIRYNITEQVTLQNQLQDAITEFKELFLKSPIPMVLATTTLKRERVNSTFTELFGYTEDEVTDIYAWWEKAFRHKTISDSVKNKWLAAARKASQKGVVPPPFSTSIIDKYGNKRFVNILFAIIGNKYLISIYDLTEQVKAKREAERTQKIIENSPHVIWHLSFDKSGREKLVFITENIKQFGYTAEELMKGNKPISKLFTHPEEYEKIRRIGRSNLRKGKNSFEFQHRIVTKEGKVLWMHGFNYVRWIKKNESFEWIGIETDITKSKLYEIELERQRNIYSAIFQNIPLGIFYFDNKGIIIDFNDKFVRILNSSKAKLRNLNLLEKLTNKGVIKAVKLTLSGKKGYYEGPYQAVTSGAVKDIRLLTVPVKVNDKGENFGLAILEDVTERIEAQKELEETRDKLREILSNQNFILQNIDDIIYHQNSKGEYTFISPSVKKMLGYTPSEFIELRKKKTLFTENQINKQAKKNLSIILKKGQKVKPYKAELFTKKGKRILVEIKESPIVENKKVTGLIGVARDITAEYERNKIQDAILKISAAKDLSHNLDNLYQRIYEIVTELMPTKNVFFAVLNKNKNMLSFEFFKDENDEKPAPHPPGHGFTEYILRKKKSGIYKANRLQKLIDKGEINLIGTLPKVVLAIYFKFSDNFEGVSLLQDYNNEYAYGKKELSFMKFVSDEIIFAINKKRAEEELIRSNAEIRLAEKKIRKQAEELMKINVNKDKFFSIIAHDLRSPFTALLGLSQMLSESIDDFERDEIVEIADSLFNSSSNILKLIENLLNWSRIQLGSFEIAPSAFEFFVAVTATLELLSEAANQKNIKLINRVPKKIFIYADITNVKMIVRNLVNNAIKFTPAGGKITVSARKIKGFVKVTISDTGIGIPKEMIGKLFNISEKVSRPGTNHEPGTGLGLILVKELVEKNGGTIEVKSEEGKGSKFIFTLKLATDEQLKKLNNEVN